MKKMYEDGLAEWLDGTIGFVEATDFERHALWVMNKELDEHPLTWTQILDGRFVEISEFGGLPVCLSLSADIVGGHKVIFYDAVSLVTHSDIIEGFITKWAPKLARKDGRVNKTNAMNFSNIFGQRELARV